MKLTKQAAPLLKEWADMILFANYKTIVVKDGTGEHAKAKAQGGKRVMYTSHHPCWDAKNRHGLAEELPFEYGAIAHCIPDMSAVNAPATPAPANSAAGGVTVDEANGQLCSMADSSAPKETVVQDASGVKSTKPKVTEEVLSSDIPKPLRDLMIANQVEEWEIQLAVANKGYFPRETPISNYGAEFINGALIAGWPQLFELILSNRDLPF